MQLRLQSRSILAMLLVCGRLSAGASADTGADNRTDTRAVVPSVEQQAKLRKSVQLQYLDLYSSDEKADQLTLAKTLSLVSTDAETTDYQFALLAEARDITARTGNLDGADVICQTIVNKFAITLSSVRVGSFKASATSISDPETFFPALASAIDTALLSDDFAPARELLETGSAAATGIQSAKWQQAFASRQQRLQTQAKYYSTIRTSLDALRENPADADSNVVAGEYECFVKDNWPAGLKMLSHGSDRALAKLAATELTDPTDTDEQIHLIDDWLSVADKLPAFTRQLQVHAYDWSIRTLPLATIPDKRKYVEDLLSTLIPQAQSDRDYPTLWLAVAQSLSNRAYRSSDMIGGPQALDPFQDVAKSGGILVGLHVGIATLGDKKVITCCQPIYLTPTGEKDGVLCGTAFSKLQTIHAPDGYAIGAMTVRYDVTVNSITPIYLRIQDNHLNSDDRRAGPRVGGPGGAEVNLDGRGTPVVGISGKQTNGYLSLGLVYSAAVKND